MNNKKIIAFLTSLVLCGNIIPRLNYFTLNNDITVIAETVNTDNFSCLVWEGTYNGSYNTTTKLNLRIHMTMGNGTAYVSVSEIGGTLSGSYSFTTEINGNSIIFTGTNGAVYGKTFKGIINPYTYNISGNSTNSTIQGNFSFKAGINTYNSNNEDNSIISQKDQINLSKYVVSPLDIVIDGNMSTKNYVELYTPNLEYFQYDNEEYNYDLSIDCAKYAALAYQEYKYDNINDIFYSVKDTSVQEPYELKSELSRDGFLNIKNSFTTPNSSYKDNDRNNVSFTLAYKKVFREGHIEYLTLVIIRGTDTIEWEGNMDVMGETYDADCRDHYSFRLGAECVKENLLNYLTENSITNSNIIITGHSRGAAVGNLLAKDLTDISSTESTIGKVYAYTYATPNNTLDANENGYNNIYNYCFTDDFVPQVPLQLWGYNKYGVTFDLNTAENLYNSNEYFKNRMNLSTSKTTNISRSEPEFDADKCNNLINYVSSKWNTINDYYNLYLPHLVGTTYVDENESLYDFFRNRVAKAAYKGTFSALSFKMFDEFNNEYSSNYSPIANFFIDGLNQRACINDTHQMYTYYNALKVNGFETTNTNILNTFKLSENSENIYNTTNINYNTNDIEKLKTFISQNDNNSILEWDLEDISTWCGIEWVSIDDEYYVQSIDFSSCNLTGILDLSNMTQLNNVVCSNNNLETIDLSNCPNLKSLNCNNSNVHTLDLTDSQTNLESLYIEYNYLDLTQYKYLLTTMENNISKNIGYKQQYINTEDISTNDLKNLLTIGNQNIGLNWNDENIGSTNGLYWNKDTDGKYHLIELDLSYTNIIGDLDLSAFSSLTTVKLTSTKVTNVILPNSIETLLDYAFYDCNYLKSIKIANKNTKIGNGVFYYTPTSLKIYAPNNSTLQSYCLENNMRFIALESLENDYIIGDVNEDGNVNVLDKILLKQYIIEGISLTDTAIKNADTNQDGNISVEDIKRLSEIILKGWN